MIIPVPTLELTEADFPPPRSLLEEMCSLGWPYKPCSAVAVADSSTTTLDPSTWVNYHVGSPPSVVHSSGRVVRMVRGASGPVANAQIVCTLLPE